MVDYQLNKPIFENLEAVPNSGYYERFSLMWIGQDSEENPDLLLSVINKAIKKISQEEIQQSIIEYTTRMPYRLSVSEVCYKYRIPLAIIAVLILLVLLISIHYIQNRSRQFRLLSSANRKLEEKNHQINRTNEQLSEAILQANQAKSDFLARMSHEIRTPLNAVIGEATIAQKNLASRDNIAECLQKIMTASRHLLHIGVKDTGCGMSADYQKRLFRPFEQESELTAKEHGGSGLGLSITKSLAELMNGSIQIESEQNVGTSVLITIPVEEADSQIQVSEGQITSLHAIVIDDDERALEYAASILDHIGISYDTECDVERALQLITKARNDRKMYDLCLIDWKMEKMDGLELTRRIRLACGQEPMVVVASAYDLNEIGDEIETAGVDACITKPLFQSTVFNILMSLSQGKLVNKNAGAEEYGFSGKHILLVDDTEINREIAEELLEMVNFKVDTAVDGKAALQQFERSEPGTYDIILMDIQMPVMNGYDAARAIRASRHPDADTVYIIAMTANAFAEDITRSLDSGMDDPISKPIDTELLYEVLGRYLSAERRHF